MIASRRFVPVVRAAPKARCLAERTGRSPNLTASSVPTRRSTAPRSDRRPPNWAGDRKNDKGVANESCERSARASGVASLGASDVWFVGTAFSPTTSIQHYDGLAWSPSPSGATANLGAVWGSAAAGMWAVGSRATVLCHS